MAPPPRLTLALMLCVLAMSMYWQLREEGASLYAQVSGVAPHVRGGERALRVRGAARDTDALCTLQDAVEEAESEYQQLREAISAMSCMQTSDIESDTKKVAAPRRRRKPRAPLAPRGLLA